ncbi:MAG: PaaI family thioesterase [Gaiellaceae bacterium]
MDEALTDSVNSTAPFGRLLGIEWVSAGPDEVVARLAWDESRCTAGGILHGGALMGLADSAGGLLAFLNLPAGAAGTATIESKTNFLGAVRGGTVHATARALHKGKRTIVIDTDLRDDDGRLVARVTQTQAVLI